MISRRINIEKMCYKKDKISYLLVILGLVFNVFYFFTLYKNNDNFYYTYQMGISVLYNLIFMLLVFLSAEEIKNYHRNFDIILFIVGIIQFLRIFWYPKAAYDNNVLSMNTYTLIAVYLCLSGILIIFGAINNFDKSTLLKKYMSQIANEVK